MSTASRDLREVALPQILVIGRNGKTVLISDTQPTQCAADEVITYESYSVQWPISYAGVSVRAADPSGSSCP